MPGNRISVYVKDGKLFRDIKLLADFDNLTLTDLVNKLLEDFVQSREEHLTVLRRQAEEREALKGTE